jgi:hypothetical protein
LTVEQILAWADDHHAHTGRWPRCTDLHVRADLNEKWKNIDSLLRKGGRGLDGGSSLRYLLGKRRGVRNTGDLPYLSEDLILAWADDYRRRTGRFPTAKGEPGPIPGAPGEKWPNIDQALRDGFRGLPGGSSLTQLLVQKRGMRSLFYQPDLTEDQIVAWAEAHNRRTGRWPNVESGRIVEAPDETWSGVNHALTEGRRGLSRPETLVQLLARCLGRPNLRAVQRLTRARILAWADAHHTRTGRWPKIGSGPIVDAPGETWQRIHWALQGGLRGLKGRTSLPRLLARYRGARNKSRSPPLTVRKILRWADAHYRRTGRWPVAGSGAIAESPDDTWAAVEGALQQGTRGLPGGDSIAKLLNRERRAQRK